LNTGSPKSVVLTFWARNSILPAKSFSTISLTRVGAEGEFPMPGHDVHAEQLAGVDHVLALRPQRGGRALPGIAAVEQQGAGARGAQALDQGGEVGEAADLAVGLRRRGEVEVGEGMRLDRCFGLMLKALSRCSPTRCGGLALALRRCRG
jgi:hypothetical protein